MCKLEHKKQLSAGGRERPSWGCVLVGVLLSRPGRNQRCSGECGPPRQAPEKS